MNKPSGSSPPALLGRRFGEFVVKEAMGRGGFGTIYRAEQVGLERQAVVKVLAPRFAADETGRLRFLREARLATTLDHPYAAHVYAFGAEPDGVLWIAMELVRGRTLTEVIARGPMPLRTFVPFFERLCEVVHTAHEHGIVHRDIKARNVMVIQRAGALLPKLLDLGIAKDVAGEVSGAAPTQRAPEGFNSPADPTDLSTLVEAVGASETVGREPFRSSMPPAGLSLTSVDEVVGTPAYMAPEQWMSGDVDPRCDIYALGILAYEAIVGRIPFEGTFSEVKRKHLNAPLPRLPKDVPLELRAVLDRATAKAPAARYPTALEFARDFRLASREDAGLEVPKLARDVNEAALISYPQPLAEAAAELEGARGPYQALDAHGRLVRVVVRWLAVVGLAAWQAQRADRPLAPGGIELLLALRKRRLTDDEWFELARACAAPFASHEESHPVPELVRFCNDDGAIETLAALLRRHVRRSGETLPTERLVADELVSLLAKTGDVLRPLKFLSAYPLAVVAEGGVAELWTGVRRKHRPVVPLPPAAPLTPGDPLLLVARAPVLSLAPLAIAREPSPNTDRELFFIDGRGRRGLLHVAFPGGFERTSDEAARWLDQVSAATEDPESLDVRLDVPYRGLAPLTAADADQFFGREREVEAFLNRLRTEPLLVVVGPSGAGKSSFVRAGILPSLGDTSRAVVFRPGATPLETLRSKLAELGVTAASRAEDAAVIAARVHAVARARDETIVFAVDQFEEAFTLCRDPQERGVFCQWLVAMASGRAQARVILTLRDDFLGRLQEEGAFRHRVAQALVLLATPDEADLRRILVEPARRAGVVFENEVLVDAMVRAVAGHPGALALLSFAASKLWEQRDKEASLLRAAAYEAMGGVAGALATHGEAVLEGMTPRQRALVREAFRRLVTADGTRSTTRPDELLSALGGDDSARAVIERLVTARLLVVAEGSDGADSVEVIHEALLTAWPRLVQWQREDVAGSRFRDQVRAAAQQWETRGRSRGLLWRGDVVDEYRRWRLRNPVGLTASEEAFGKASLGERDRGRRVRAAVVVLLAVAAVLVAWQQSVARRAAQRATEAAERSALRARDAARLAAAHLRADDPTTQLALLRDVEAAEPLPAWESEARAALHAGVASVVLTGHESIAWSVAFSPDGRRLVSSSDDRTARIWNADGTGVPIVLGGHTSGVRCAAFSPDGRRVASGSGGTVRVWNSDGSGEPLALNGPEREILSVAFSPDGRSIVASSVDETVRLWKADGSGEPLVFRGHTASVTSVAFGPEGRRVASGSVDATVRVWSADGSGEPLVLRGHTSGVNAVAFSPDGLHIASGARDGSIFVWNADGSGLPVVLQGGSEIGGLAFSPDSRTIVAGTENGNIRLLRADGSGTVRAFSGQTSGVYSVAFAPDGRRIVSADLAGTLRVWRVDLLQEPLVLGRHPSPIAGLAVSPDDRFVASASDDGTVRVERIDGAGEPVVLHGHTDHVNGVAFSVYGTRVASVSDDRTVRIWNSDGSGTPKVLRGHTDRVNVVAFSPDGAHVASGGSDHTVRIWNIDGSGDPLVLQGHVNAVWGLAYAPDGKTIASGAADKTVRVWPVDGRGDPLVLQGHTVGVTDLAFSPDGRRLASSSLDRSVRVFSADGTGTPVVFHGNENIYSVDFSPDGTRVAWVSGNAVRVANVDGHGTPIVLVGHTGGLKDAIFAPDGRLLSTGDDATIRVWSDLSRLQPSDPRLWEATDYCLPVESLEDLLGVGDDVASSLRTRCAQRVNAARTPSLP